MIVLHFSIAIFLLIIILYKINLALFKCVLRFLIILLIINFLLKFQSLIALFSLFDLRCFMISQFKDVSR